MFERLQKLSDRFMEFMRAFPSIGGADVCRHTSSTPSVGDDEPFFL